MIVRILGEGQFEVDEDQRGHLEELDAALETAFQANDADGFAAALSMVHDEIRRLGRPLDPTTITTSELALPSSGSRLEEVRALLESENPSVS